MSILMTLLSFQGLASKPTPPPSVTLAEPSYTNGDGQTGAIKMGRSASTLPPGVSLPDANRSSSLDSGPGGEPLAKPFKDKKRHSMFGGIFKKKKDKGDKL